MKLRKIRSKLLLLLSAFFLLQAALYIAFHVGGSRVYGRALTQSIRYVLEFVAADVDRRMSDIETASLAIMAGAGFQSMLRGYASAPTTYDQHQLRGRIHDVIAPYLLSPYIRAAIVVDSLGRLIVGNDGLTIAGNDLDRAVNAGRAADGAVAWVATDDGRRLIASRRVRRVDDFSFAPIGVLLIDVAIRPMLVDTIRDFASFGVILSVQVGDAVLLSSEGDATRARYLTYTAHSTRTGRIYTAYLPRSVVYARIDRLDRWALVALLTITGIAVAAAVLLTTHITHPVEALVSRLRRLEGSDFSETSVRFSLPGRADEIGLLYGEVDAMFAKISRLINENYKRLIAIKDNQFRTLQAQINPHFLYNTLESITWLAKLQRHDEIGDMVKSLGALLRASIRGDEYAVTITRESELLRSYLTIQGIRYGEDLRCEVEIAPETVAVAVPKLILQPLVENSIKYGLEARKGVCHIRVATGMDSGRVVITVVDNGPGIEAARLRDLNLGRIRAQGSGVGIRNIAERFALIYGSEASVDVISKPDRGTTVLLRVPVVSVEDLERRIST